MGKAVQSSHAEAIQHARHLQIMAERTAQLTELEMLQCLKDVPQDELEQLLDICWFRGFPTHSTIIHESDPQSCFYLVLQGRLMLTLHDREGRAIALGELRRGDCFGEEALQSNSAHHVSAVAVTSCQLIQISCTGLAPLLGQLPLLRQMLNQLYRERLALYTLARVPLFSELLSSERLALAQRMQMRRYPNGTTVVQQGERGDALYLIQSGQLVVEQDQTPIALLGQGEFFGEMALLTQEVRTASVIAATGAELLVLSAVDFAEMLLRQPTLRERLRQVIELRRETQARLRQNQVLTRRVNLALSHGLLRGGHLLVRDLESCDPACRRCEEGCRERHGHKRLRTDGIAIDHYDIVDTCRQCQFEAECAAACPEDAFVWNAKGALTITNACTGCGACVPACPYDAVTRVERSYSGQQWGALRRIFKRSPLPHSGVPVIPLVSTPSTHRADKCDLCDGYDDLACVSACPTGALRLVPVEEILPI